MFYKWFKGKRIWKEDWGGKKVLTTLEALGEAPLWSRFFTMFRWPMNAATWRGVRPDCTQTRVEAQYQCITQESRDLLVYSLRFGQKRTEKISNSLSMPLFMFRLPCCHMASPLWQLLGKQSAWAAGPWTACGSSCKQYGEVWSHSGNTVEKGHN